MCIGGASNPNQQAGLCVEGVGSGPYSGRACCSEEHPYITNSSNWLVRC